MFEGTFSPPVYNDLYNFLDGAQDDIFVDSYVSIPDPAPNAAMPVPASASAIPSNSTTGGAHACTTKANAGLASTSASDYSSSYKRDMSDVQKRSTSRLAFIEMSKRSGIHRRDRLWNMW
jgi:hypothetical protein